MYNVSPCARMLRVVAYIEMAMVHLRAGDGGSASSGGSDPVMLDADMTGRPGAVHVLREALLELPDEPLLHAALADVFSAPGNAVVGGFVLATSPAAAAALTHVRASGGDAGRGGRGGVSSSSGSGSPDELVLANRHYRSALRLWDAQASAADAAAATLGVDPAVLFPHHSHRHATVWHPSLCACQPCGTVGTCLWPFQAAPSSALPLRTVAACRSAWLTLDRGGDGVAAFDDALALLRRDDGARNVSDGVAASAIAMLSSSQSLGRVLAQLVDEGNGGGGVTGAVGVSEVDVDAAVQHVVSTTVTECGKDRADVAQRFSSAVPFWCHPKFLQQMSAALHKQVTCVHGACRRLPVPTVPSSIVDASVPEVFVCRCRCVHRNFERLRLSS